MNTVQKIAQNSIFIFIGQIARVFLGMVLVVYMTRYLGAIKYGRYAFAVSFTSLFLIFANPGLNVLGIREIARKPQEANKYLTNASFIKLVLSFIMIIMAFVVINLMHYPKETITVVYIVAFIVFFVSFGTFLRSVFRAFEKMKYETFTMIIERILVTGVGLLGLFLGYGLIKILCMMLLAQLVGFLLTYLILIRKFARPRLAMLDFSFIKKLIKLALPFAAAFIFSTIYAQTDTVMLSVMKGDAVVAWYNAAHKLVWGIRLIPTAIVGSIYPVISKYFISSKDNLKIAYEKSFKFLAILAIPMGIGTTLIADRIIYFLYGKEFASSIGALQVLIWSGSLIFLTSIIGYVLVSINRQIVDTRVVCIAAFTNVILNLLLIPRFSYIGAGIASVISFIIIFIYEFNYLQKHFYRIYVFKITLKPLFAALIMGVIIYVLKIIFTNLFILIFSGMGSYIILLYTFKVFNHQELGLIRNIFVRSK